MAEPQPNLLILYTDQQSRWTIGAYGSPEGARIGTPNIDRLAAEGVRFDNFFTNAAVCTPSRGCLLTGHYPHRHGAYHNNIPINPDEVTLGRTLADAGWQTGYLGKWHLDTPGAVGRPGWVPPDRAMGFDDCRFMFNSSHAKGVIERAGGPPELHPDPEQGRYMTDWLGDKAIEFISRRRDRPFALVVGVPDPHEPYRVREPYASLFRPEEMTLPATFADEGAPSWARERLDGCGSVFDEPDPEQALREQRAAYCGEVKCIDDNVGRILAALEDRGILDDTVVVFTTDHGDYMGEHGLVGKNRCFEGVYRIPLLIRWPRAIAPGSVVRRFVTTVDFRQTVLGLIGIGPTGYESGRDASPLVRGEGVDWTDEAYFHHSHFDFTGVFTPAYELALARNGEHVLWDRADDPDQTRNLYDDPAHAEVVDELKARVIEHNRAVGAPALHTWLLGYDGRPAV